MGLRCLMGHDYGDTRTERDREERGDEAVVTVREYQECSRCGYRRITSENKEVISTAEPEPEPEPEPDAEAGGEYDEVTAEEDDGVILEEGDEEEGEERDAGAWPEREDPEEVEADHEEWPDPEGEDEGYAAEPSDGGPAEEVEFEGGIAPEREDPEEDEGTAAGIRSAEPAGGQRVVAADTEFVCPECGHTAPGAESSLRPGDICPECRRGYLAEREA